VTGKVLFLSPSSFPVPKIQKWKNWQPIWRMTGIRPANKKSGSANLDFFLGLQPKTGGFIDIINQAFVWVSNQKKKSKFAEPLLCHPKNHF
jgi:hypothetical protein